MKGTMFFGLVTAVFLFSCSNNSNQSSATTADSATNAQSNTTAAPTGDSTAGTTPTAVTSGGSFKEVMDQMMKDMQGMAMTGDPDHDFATMMKRHHQGAIDMAHIELSKGSNAEVKQIAQKTIDDAQKDINDLNTFLTNHQPAKKTDFSQKQMDKMMKSMNMDMGSSGDVDKDFAMMMTMHHQEGIDMARDYLKVGTSDETKKVANNTIKSNGEGIKKLKPFGGSTASHDMDKMDKDMKGMDMKDMKGMDMKDTEKSKSATGHSQHQ